MEKQLSELQLKMLDMMKWFHQFCIENNITYYMVGGTMLGAARHRGFIPWDDDIDVGVPRKDYNRLLEIAKDLNGKYILESWRNGNDDYEYPYAKVYDTSTTLIENKRKKPRRGIFIDVFPLDGIGTSMEDALTNFKPIGRKLDMLAARSCAVREGRSGIKNLIVRIVGVMPPFIIALREEECKELFELARERGLILMDAIKTAYSTAYERLVLLAKAGKIGDVVSVDAVCTSLRDGIAVEGVDLSQKWNSMAGWAPVALLPVFQILGTNYKQKTITTKFLDVDANMDAFTKIDFVYSGAVASIKVAKAAKAEGELVISGSKGYIYVPAPWWKTDYFEVRYENQEENRRFFYQLDGEGIKFEKRGRRLDIVKRA